MQYLELSLAQLGPLWQAQAPDLQGRVVFAERKLAGPALPSVAGALAFAPARRHPRSFLLVHAA